jgi:formylglycine-generating enzyme required for sulfatase activity
MELGDNLSEWVADPPSAAGARTLRGGSWTSPTPTDMRAARRALAPADVKLPDIGFRCVFDGSAP